MFAVIVALGAAAITSHYEVVASSGGGAAGGDPGAADVTHEIKNEVNEDGKREIENNIDVKVERPSAHETPEIHKNIDAQQPEESSPTSQELLAWVTSGQIDAMRKWTGTNNEG